MQGENIRKFLCCFLAYLKLSLNWCLLVLKPPLVQVASWYNIQKCGCSGAEELLKESGTDEKTTTVLLQRKKNSFFMC